MTPIEIILQSMHDSGLDDPTTEDAKAALTALSEAGWSLVPSEATQGVFRPSSIAGSVEKALREMGPDGMEWIDHKEEPWQSVSFSGHRVDVTLGFSDPSMGELFVKRLPDHEFAIPGKLVAEAYAELANADTAQSEAFRVKVELLILEDR